MKKKLSLLLLSACFITVVGCGSKQTVNVLPTINTPVPTVTNTPVPTIEPTTTPTPVPTIEPTATLTPVPTVTNTPTPVPTVEPTATLTPIPTITNTPTPVPTVEPTATLTPVPAVTNTPTPVPATTNTPTPVPTVGPTATLTPIPAMTNTPTPVPTVEPTATLTPVPTMTNTPTPSPQPTKVAANKDVSMYLVFDSETLDNVNFGDYEEFGYKKEHYDEYNDNNPNTNIAPVIYHVTNDLPLSYVSVYEFTERPEYAGKVRTIILSDEALLPKNLLKYNLQVGDIVQTESIAYEQDGNFQNGKEAIVWVVDKVQYIYSVYSLKTNPRNAMLGKPSRCGQGANFSANYFLRATKTLDYDEYFKFENQTSLYTGTALSQQTYDNILDKAYSSAEESFVFDSLQGVDIDFKLLEKNTSDLYWNTCNTSIFTGMISIYKSDGIDMHVKPTQYALSKGIPVTKDGYVKWNWLYGTSPYLVNEKTVSYRGLTVSPEGNLRWNHPYSDKAGFRPELTLWTGIDTCELHENGFDLTIDQVKDGTWREMYEINYEIWKDYEDFIRWDLP